MRFEGGGDVQSLLPRARADQEKTASFARPGSVGFFLRSGECKRPQGGDPLSGPVAEVRGTGERADQRGVLA